MSRLDVLIPTYRRPAALAVTLTSLVGQTFRDFRLVVSDQTEDGDPLHTAEVQAVVRVLRLHGHDIVLLKHLPRRGMAEHRQFLLSQVRAPYALFLDDDLVLDPDLLARLVRAIRREPVGFVGCGLIGLSYTEDVRPDEQHLELWDGPVRPERVTPDLPSWQRYRLHNAANVLHVQQGLGLQPGQDVRYRVAWIGGCVLYDAEKLREAGGFSFWPELSPEHGGEDVLAQLRVMARFGGFGLLPSGVYHQELPTTVPTRSIDAPKALDLDPPFPVDGEMASRAAVPIDRAVSSATRRWAAAWKEGKRAAGGGGGQ